MTDAKQMTWDDHQQWESDWWGKCINTYAEETKQITYAHRMGLINEPRNGQWPVYNMKGQSVIDIGGGPCSMLLHTFNLGQAWVVDPCKYPEWVAARYAEANIDYCRYAAEEAGWLPLDKVNELWIYNVLQHTQSPETIIHNAKKAARTIRIFEWIDMPKTPGHPHTLREDSLNEWLGGTGITEQMNENGCVGRAYYGEFHVKG